MVLHRRATNKGLHPLRLRLSLLIVSLLGSHQSLPCAKGGGCPKGRRRDCCCAKAHNPPVSLTADRAGCQASATLSWKTSAGVFQLRHFLGRQLSRCSTAATSSAETVRKSNPLQKKNLTMSFVFSLVPRCQGL